MAGIAAQVNGVLERRHAPGKLKELEKVPGGGRWRPDQYQPHRLEPPGAGRANAHPHAAYR
jgi:hypothetical protein